MDSVDGNIISGLGQVDLTAPGYNYFGPGNPMDNGEPINKLDKIAQDHDLEYEEARDDFDILGSDIKASGRMLNNVFHSSSIGEAELSVLGSIALGAKAAEEGIFDVLGVQNPLKYPSDLPSMYTKDALQSALSSNNPVIGQVSALASRASAAIDPNLNQAQLDSIYGATYVVGNTLTE